MPKPKNPDTSGLKRGNPGLRKPKALKPELVLYCAKRALGMGVERAAAEVGISSGYAWTLNRDPKIDAQIKSFREQAKEKILTDEVRDFQLSLEHADLEVTRVAGMQKPHKYRGFADKTHSIELIYRRLRAIQPKTNVQATAVAGAQVVGATMGAVYKSRWLIEKEQQLRLQAQKS